MPIRSRSARSPLPGAYQRNQQQPAVVAEDRHLARVTGSMALEDLHGGGLAGAVGAEQGHDLPGSDVE